MPTIEHFQVELDELNHPNSAVNGFVKRMREEEHVDCECCQVHIRNAAFMYRIIKAASKKTMSDAYLYDLKNEAKFWSKQLKGYDLIK